MCVQLGQEMLAEEHYNSKSIERKSTQLSGRWRKLQDKMADRGDKLRQAGQQEQLMELLQVRRDRLTSRSLITQPGVAFIQFASFVKKLNY